MIQPLPNFTATPGMPVDAVKQKSSARISAFTSRGQGLVQARDEHHFVISRQNDVTNLVFPASLFSVVYAKSDRVERILTTPQTQYLNGMDTLDLLVDLKHLLLTNGWIRMKDARGHLTTIARLPVKVSERVALFRFGDLRADMVVRREVEGGSAQATLMDTNGHAFLVTVNIWSEND